MYDTAERPCLVLRPQANGLQINKQISRIYTHQPVRVEAVMDLLYRSRKKGAFTIDYRLNKAGPTHIILDAEKASILSSAFNLGSMLHMMEPASSQLVVPLRARSSLSLGGL